MILQALTKYYEDLADKGKISRPGWAEGKVSYALRIDDDGKLIDVMLLTSEEERNGKKVLLPKKMTIPAPVKRSSGIAPNFLCDNSIYILGIGDINKKKRTIQCFEACRNLHNEILKDVDSCAAKALRNFFNNWEPEKGEESSVLAEYKEDIIKDANLTFWYGDGFILEDVFIMEAWNRQYQNNNVDTEMVCLVTGKKGKVEAIHPSIKGIRGAQTAGAALVSFNADAFESYNKKQNYNAPVSSYATFAYTTALNYLIADRDNVNYIGDTAILLWAEGAETGFRSLANMCLFGTKENNYSTKDIIEKMKRIASGKKIEFDETMLDPDRKFYVLGIAPNAARLSVRFFWCNTFGTFMKNIEEHYKRLEIVKPEYDTLDDLPIWMLLGETINQKSKTKMASPNMAGQFLQAILSDYRYPATLLNNINIRIRADREINRCRAAIIKAYYLKNRNVEVPEEVLEVALNTETKNVPYNLGRLFAVLENIQQKANPGINTTIRDKYLNSASSTPAVVFPILLNLSQKHLNKIGGGLQVTLSKEMQDIMDKFDEEFPKRLTLAQQGSFQLGYYHQTQARYQSKSKED